MRTVKILESFEGWPDGKSPKNFVQGDEVEVANDFADLIIGKGHAKEVSGKAAAKEAPAAAKKDGSE
jgi:hypothetical protein